MKIEIKIPSVITRIFWWSIGWMFKERCIECGKPLSREEIYYYGKTCNSCEGERYKKC